MNISFKIPKSLLIPILLLILATAIFPVITPQHLHEHSELKFKNKGNCYLIDNRYIHSFNLQDLNESIVLDASENANDFNEKIFLKFCNWDNKNKNNYNNNNEIDSSSLVKIFKGENGLETWYNYTYDSKVWDYDNKLNALKIKFLTNRDCKLAKEGIIGNNSISNNESDNYNFNFNDNSTSQFANLKLTITINIHCNRNVTEAENIRPLNSKWELKNFITNVTECNKNLNFESRLVCPVNSALNLHRFYSEYSFVFGLFYIILGFFMLSYGNSFELITYYLNGILFSRMICLYIEQFLLQEFLQVEKDYGGIEWLLWPLEVLSILMGTVIGYYIKRFPEAKIFFLGSMTGHVICYLIWLPLCYFITFKPYIFYFCFHIISFGLTGIISQKCFANSKNFLIISCAVIGSYITVKGVSYYVGGLSPDKFFLQMMEKMEYENTRRFLYYPTNLIYLIMYFALLIFSIMYQSMAPFLFDNKVNDSQVGISHAESSEKLVSFSHSTNTYKT